ncbi:MAG: response regulator, partial [Anaerolineae bacterium]|nr:response regulator [Anaerolineae bacterium]
MSETTILVVDDESGIIRLCERLLTRAGYRVFAYTDPEDGLELLKQEEVDLLLVDIRMPKMDGFEVIELGRKQQPDMGVVIMTGFGTLETAIRALRRGADGLILKPFEDRDELVKTIRRAMEERQHKQEAARLRAIRPLLDMTETLLFETRHEALVDLILKAIRGHLRCSHAGIYRREPGEKNMELIASSGKPLPGEESHAEAGPVGRANHWKTPVWVNREGPGDAKLQAILGEQHLGAVICIPVARGESRLVFFAGRDMEEGAFELADLDIFGILARQADVAMENARLYSELRQYVRRVEDSQRALTQAEKMAAVGRLTASIAHEVNNPLQAVSNCLHLVGREELSDEERGNYLTLAQDEMERLMLTVQRMLDFYRPGAIDRKPTDIPELLERVLKLLGQQLVNQDIEVKRQFSKPIPPAVVVSNQMQQVFFNLILNAMEAMPDGGQLAIEGKQHNGSLEILFEDTGPGISVEEQENIFEPFMSTRENGNGLGLSVSYGILTAHGGS